MRLFLTFFSFFKGNHIWCRWINDCQGPLHCLPAFACFAWQKIWFSSCPANPTWSEKNHEDDRFPFLKIPSSSIFVLALKFTQISHNSAKSCVVLLQKKQLLVLKNHDFCKNKLKYQGISYERASEKADNSLKSRNL